MDIREKIIEVLEKGYIMNIGTVEMGVYGFQQLIILLIKI